MFDGLAEVYDRQRPRYPQALYESLGLRLQGRDELLLVDVGAGTGISARGLARQFGAGARVLAIEPGADMRARAVAACADYPNIDLRAATAEATGLADGSADLVLAAQAAHWFDRPKYYAEVARILRPGGLIAFAHNNRDWRNSGFMSAQEALLEKHIDGYDRRYRAFDFVGELKALDWTSDVKNQQYHWQREMTFDDYVGLVCSSSKAPKLLASLGEDGLRAALRASADSHGFTDSVTLDMVSHLDAARKR